MAYHVDGVDLQRLLAEVLEHEDEVEVLEAVDDALEVGHLVRGRGRVRAKARVRARVRARVTARVRARVNVRVRVRVQVRVRVRVQVRVRVRV